MTNFTSWGSVVSGNKYGILDSVIYHLPFDEQSGNPNDIVGDINASSFNIDYQVDEQNSFGFNGTDGYVDLNQNPSSLQLEGNEPWTVAFALRPDQISEHNRFLDNYDRDIIDGFGIGVWDENGGELRGFTWDDSGNQTYSKYPVDPGEWYTVIATWTTDPRPDMWVNLDEADKTGGSGTSEMRYTDQSIKFGRQSNPDERYGEGAAYDLMFFDDRLDESEREKVHNFMLNR